MSHPYWVAFSSIVEKEVKRFLRIWPQTLLPPAITMVLYFVISILVSCIYLQLVQFQF